MRLLVLGATGGTGRAIAREATARGHRVSALARSKDRAAGLDVADLRVGDVLDGKTLEGALAGCDAVISSLGTEVSPFREVTFLSEATEALVDAMKKSGVRRLVCITGMGAGDSRGHGGFVMNNIVMPLLLRKVYADKDRQEALVRASGLDWVLVRPSVLNDKTPRGEVRALTDLTSFDGGMISRGDVAKFAVEQVDSDEWLGRAPLITW